MEDVAELYPLKKPEQRSARRALADFSLAIIVYTVNRED
jgi:hypothetical protein